MSDDMKRIQLSPSAYKTMEGGFFIGESPIVDFIASMCDHLTEQQDLKFVRWLNEEILQHPDLCQFLAHRITLRRDIKVDPIHRVEDGVQRFNVGVGATYRYHFNYHRLSLKDRIKFFIFDLRDWWRTRDCL